MNGDRKLAGATAVSASPFAPLPSSRTTHPQPIASTPPVAAPNTTMSPSSYHPNPQPIGPPTSNTSSFALPIGTSSTNGFDRELSLPSNSPFNFLSSAAASPTNSVLIRRLPLGTTDEKLRLMTVFSKELTSVELLPPDRSDDSGYRSAVLSFESPEGAHEAKAMLDGKLNFASDAQMIVELLNSNGTRRLTADLSANGTPASSVASSRGSSRFPRSFHGLDGIQSSVTSVYGNGASTAGAADLANSEPVGSAHSYQNIFSPQSPIGNHLTDRTRISGKALINNDTASDDETRELLKDPVAYAEIGNLSAAMAAAAATAPQQSPHSHQGRPQHHQQRRTTASQASLSQRLASLSLNTSGVGAPVSGPASAFAGAGATVPSYGQSAGSMSAHPLTMSPSLLNGPAVQQQPGVYHHYRNHNLPPANPADQNPPCNTLYVGNLPMNTSEEELKAMFSKQRGYKRLCFRTKQNGPMCFVEFEDISFATKALHELYGTMLHNSVKGGIRLSFSKNPLGVRSGQNPPQMGMGASMGVSAGTGMNSMLSGAGSNGFVAASGPPPGLAAPPGLGLGRTSYSNSATPLQNGTPGPIGGSAFGPPPSYAATNGWGNASLYHSSLNGDGVNSNPLTNGGTTAGYPSFMMGR